MDINAKKKISNWFEEILTSNFEPNKKLTFSTRIKNNTFLKDCVLQILETQESPKCKYVLKFIYPNKTEFNLIEAKEFNEFKAKLNCVDFSSIIAVSTLDDINSWVEDIKKTKLSEVLSLKLNYFAVFQLAYSDFTLKAWSGELFGYYLSFYYPNNKEVSLIYSNSLENFHEELDKFDFSKIMRGIAQEEILFYFKNPIEYLDLYKNFNSVESNVHWILMYRDANELNSLKTSLAIDKLAMVEKEEETQVSPYSDDEFLEDSSFVNNFVVLKFFQEEGRSSRRRDDYSKKIEYCLYYRGIRVNDDYISSILPNPIVDSESEYNDSTPGLNFKKLYYEISFLETERFLEKYNLKDHCNFLAPNLKSTKQQFCHVELQTVFHELGHFVGLELLKMIGYDFGNVLMINLNSKYPPAQIKIDNDLFRYKTNLNSDEKSQDHNRIKVNLNKDVKRVLAYILYLLMGGVFNVYYFKPKPDYYDFIMLFKNDNSLEKYGDFVARAGNDFFTIHNLRFDLDWGKYDFENFKYLALEIFYIFDKYNLFYHIKEKEFFNEFEKDFNGKTIKNEVLINKYSKRINEILSQEHFINEIWLLLHKYYLDVTRFF